MIIALLVGAGLIYIEIRLSKMAVRLIAPNNKTEDFEKVRKILSNTIATILGLIIAFIVISYIVSRFGINITPVLTTIGDWFKDHGIVVLFIIVGALILNKILNLLLPSIVQGMIKVRGRGKGARTDKKKRADTLSRFLGNVLTGIIYVVALFMILSEIGVDIGPLLVGAGFVGIAVGFAGQKVISDILNGLFIVVENYYNVGDVIQVAGITGVVEDVNIRRTILRDLDGIVHIVPNSQIEIASNYTKHWSRVNLNVPVAYGEDLDKVIEVLNKIGMEMTKDEYFGPFIITAPQVLRVDNFGDSSIDIKMLGETKPMRQWELTGELRKRIKKVFDEEGIEIPWPHTKVYFGNMPVEDEIKETKSKAAPAKPVKQQRLKSPRARKPLPPDDDSDEQ